MTATEPAHWLLRLPPQAWIDAARTELDALQRRLASEPDPRRAVVAHARRAGGMALNGVLAAWAHDDATIAAEPEAPWGRSYVDHLQHVAAGRTGPLPESVATLAAAILAVPMARPELVGLGTRRHADLHTLAQATAALVEACATALPAAV
ncbi:MAG: hypothetical protein K1X88_04630 [Nannocystaceae bacterium]|nr:hypothetical protein [Nannocystaceae bacterium]